MGDRATGAATDRIKETAMTVDPEDRNTTGAPPPTRQRAPEHQPVSSDGPTWSDGPGEPVNGPVGGPPEGVTGPGQVDGPDGPPAPDGAATPGPAETRPVVDPPLAKPQHTRLSGLWIALTSGAVVLLVLLIFILENGQKVEISFFGAHGHLPLGVALLMAAIFGVLVVVIPGAGRMIQLRMLAKRHRKQVAKLQPQPVDPNQSGTGAQNAGRPPEPAPQKKSGWRRSKN